MPRELVETGIFNLALGLAEALSLLAVRRYGRRAWPALGVLPLLAVFLAVVLTRETFGVMRLTGWAAFVHAPVMLILSALALPKAPSRLQFAAICLGVVMAAIGYEAYFIEPYRLQVNRYSIVSKKLQGLGRTVRIAVIADIQIQELGAYEKDALRRTIEAKPDIILWVGDYVQEPDVQRHHALQDALRAQLIRMGFKGPMGSFAVKGNNDQDDWARIFNGTSVRAFPEGGTFDLSIDNQTLRFTALDDPKSERTNVPLPLAQDAFSIVFGHRPDFALGAIANGTADLMIAGHTHGGQVQLPFIGPLMTLSLVPRAWAAGVHEVNGRWIAVSRGIGVERETAPQLRFLCAPEIMLLELSPPKE